MSDGGIAGIHSDRVLDAKRFASGQPGERQFKAIAEDAVEVATNLGPTLEPL